MGPWKKRPPPPTYLPPYPPLPPPCPPTLFQVRTEDGSLENVEMGSAQGAKAALAKGKVFQGGNWNHLHRMLQLRTGSDLMYVGDHMYSDILRSKRTLGWRTVLIVPELLHEVSARRECAPGVRAGSAHPKKGGATGLAVAARLASYLLLPPRLASYLLLL